MEEKTQNNCSNVTQTDRIFNINIGVLGHIDSGKTSLSKALSTLASTASFDKSPQSKERGITLDLGFSAFILPAPPHLQDAYSKIQYTLVDCPGHASLIRTIIGGAQIIDLMFLVIDATKGIQTQTAEGLVIGEITAEKMIVILNKIDLFPESERESQIHKISTKLLKTLQQTKFKNSAIIPVAACPNAKEGEKPIGIDKLFQHLSDNLVLPVRDPSGPFLFSVDHCFQIKGQGTVMTGTVLKGTVKLNQTIEIPSLKLQKKVKSMQMFHRPVQSASQGDRVGICVTQLDSKSMERGLVCDVGTVPTIERAVISASRIRFFKGTFKTKSKLHITIGHTTSMATCHFFGLNGKEEKEEFDLKQEYEYQDELLTEDSSSPRRQWALLVFETPIQVPLKSVVIGAKLDLDVNTTSCRIVFSGILLHILDSPNLSVVKVFKMKRKVGHIDRRVDEHTLIGKDMFKKETDISLFVGLKVVRSSNGAVGRIEGAFGKSGKFKVYFPEDQNDAQGNLELHFKKFMFSQEKKMIQ